VIIWRLLRWPLLLLGILLLALPVLAFSLLATEPGSRWLLRQGAEIGQDHGFLLHFEKLSGNFLGDINISGISARFGGDTLEIAELTLGWRPGELRHRRVHVTELALAGTAYRAGGGETAAAEGPPALPDLRLPVEILVDRLTVNDLSVQQGESTFVLKRARLGARLAAQHWQVSALEVAAPAFGVTGRAGFQPAPPHAVQAELAVWGQLPDLPRLGARLALDGEALAPRIRLEAHEPAVATLEGTLRLDQAEPRFDLRASAPRLTWPLDGDAEYWAEALRLTLAGTPSAYRLDAAARAGAAVAPSADIRLRGEGGLAAFRLSELRARTDRGSAAAHGSVGWAPEIRWDLDLALDALDPGVIAPDWPGELDARLATAGTLEQGRPAGQVRIDRMAGTLRGYPVGAEGSLAFAGEALRVEGLTLHSGPNRVAASGSVDERLDLGFELDAPDLTALYPGLQGRAGGNARLSGTPQRPELIADLAGVDIAFADLALAEVTLDARWLDTGGSLRLAARDGRAGEFAVTDAELRLDGTPEQHRLEASLDSPAAIARLAAAGGWDQAATRWAGQLQTLALHSEPTGQWALDAPAAVHLGPAELDLGDVCLRQESAALCVAGKYRGDALDARASLSNLPLGLLSAGLPPHLALEGALNAQARLGGSTAKPSVELALRPTDGRLIVVDDDDEPLGIRFEDVRLDAAFADDRGRAEVRMVLDGDGITSGTLALGPAPERRLEGEIDADFPDLSLVSGVVPDLTGVAGRLHLGMALGGRLASPELQGELRIDDGSADVAVVGLELRELTLSITGDGTSPLRIEGGLRSGGGRLQARGTLDPGGAAGPAVDLALTGDMVQVARLPEAGIWVSPDLRVTGTGPYHVAGQVLVPEALIELETLPKSSVKPSEDEVVIAAGEQVPEPGTAPAGVTADVRLTLGEKVRFEGFGLETRLEGSLDARVDQRTTRLDGQIALAEGRFEAFGQALTIEQGRLMFAGPPGRPEIDLRAVRVSNDQEVRAYLAANGPIRKPQTRVYSEPALPQAEALSYLLTGRGLDNANREQGIDIAAAALSLGISQGEPLLQNMGARLGLDELRVAGGDDGIESTSLVVGKYLNPDVYVGLSQNIFDPTGSILLRLRLNEYLEVETKAGEAQSVDLFYTKEHD
jgi:translocation and assembly module TamB